MKKHDEAREFADDQATLKKQSKISEALDQISQRKEKSPAPAFTSGDKAWLVFCLTGLLVVSLSRSFVLSLPSAAAYVEKYNFPANRIANSLIAIFIILVISRLLKVTVVRNVKDIPTRHNLARLFNLSIVLLVTFIIISAIFINWYTAAISLGIISLIIGVALQHPLTSFFAWLYIVIRKPYEVGDRIAMGNVTGDVIDLGYLDTTLWEFGGKYLSGDHPSGRVIRFQNSRIFSEYIYNYSWPLFPYLWNEIKFYVAYESDLAFIEKTIAKIVDDDLAEEMRRRIESYQELLQETPVEALKVKEKPAVFFRTSENTWVEVVVRYLVEPKESGRVKTRLIKQILEELRLHAEIVKFPAGNNR